jgi:hypothetical protein
VGKGKREGLKCHFVRLQLSGKELSKIKKEGSTYIHTGSAYNTACTVNK